MCFVILPVRGRAPAWAIAMGQPPQLGGFLFLLPGAQRIHGQKFEQGAGKREKQSLNRIPAQELGMPSCQRIIKQLRCHVWPAAR